MTLLEVLEATNTTLHDAELLRHSVDYQERTLRLDLDLWAGGTLDPPAERESYQLGTLIVSGLEYFFVGAQQNKLALSRPSTIDGYETRSEDIEQSDLPPVSALTFRYSLYVFDWNSFIHFAGTSATLDRHGSITNGYSRGTTCSL